MLVARKMGNSFASSQSSFSGSSSRIGGAVGSPTTKFGGIEQKLDYLALHRSDPTACVGVVQEVVGMCRRSTSDRSVMVNLVLQSQSDGGLPPFSEVLQRARMSRDVHLKCLVLQWAQLLLEGDRQDAATLVTELGIVPFIVDLLDVQSKAAVPINMLALAAAMLAQLSSSADFAEQLAISGGVSQIIVRLRFTNPGSPERQNLLECMTALAALGTTASHLEQYAKQSTVDALLRCIESSESNAEIALMAVKLLHGIFAFRTSALTVLPKHVPQLLRCYGRGSALVSPTSSMLALLLRAADDAKTLAKEVRTHQNIFFGLSFVQDESIDPGDLVAIVRCMMEDEQLRNNFIFSPQLHSFVTKASTGIKDVSISLECCELLETLASVPNAPASIVSSGALGLLLTIVGAFPLRCFNAVRLMLQLCRGNEQSSIELLQHAKFHSLLRILSGTKSTEGVYTTFECMRVLHVLLSPAVTSHADAFLVEAIQSLLCQTFVLCCPVCSLIDIDDVSNDSLCLPEYPDDTLVPSLCQRITAMALASLGACAGTAKRYAAAMLPQLPLDSLRWQLRRQLPPDHHSKIPSLAVSLVNVIAQSDDDALRELAVFGCLPSLLSKAVHLQKVTVRTVQQQWRSYQRATRASRLHYIVSVLLKDVFLWYSDVATEEHGQRTALSALEAQQRAQLNEEETQRAALWKECLWLRDSVALPERAQRVAMYMQEAISRESTVRLEVAKYVEKASRDLLCSIFRISASESESRSSALVAEAAEFKTILANHIANIRAIDCLYERRLDLNRREKVARSQWDQQESDEYREIQYRCRTGFLEVLEVEGRQDLLSSVEKAQSTMIVDVTPVLVAILCVDEKAKRKAVRDAQSSLQTELGLMHSLLQVQAAEGWQRRSACDWQLRLRAVIAREWQRVSTTQTVFEEARERSLLARTISVAWYTCLQQGDILRLMVQEEGARSKLLVEASIDRGMIGDALADTLPMAWELSECSSRRQIETDYMQSAKVLVYALAMARAQWSETQARNVVALQCYFTTRNMFVPLACLQLHVEAERALRRELAERAVLRLAEINGYAAMQERFVVQAQLIQRRLISQQQREGHERIAQYFVKVTHVVNIRSAAQRFLEKRNHSRTHATSYTPSAR